MKSINCKGRLLAIEKPLVMGIVNTSPDSFYAGSRFNSLDALLDKAAKMLEAGASIIDVGGQSTRPGSTYLPAQEEADRVVPAVEALVKKFPDIIISIDTFHAAVAEQAVMAGASMVNDISSGDMDESMIPTVAALKVPYIIMHMQGTPQTMQLNPQYQDVTTEVLDYLIAKTEACRKAGIYDVIVDPGFGFGKNLDHNMQLLRQLQALQVLGKPILAGMSRKGMIYKTLGTSATEALNGTTVMHTIALLNGADILRVHDVKEAIEAIKLVEVYKGFSA